MPEVKRADTREYVPSRIRDLHWFEFLRNHDLVTLDNHVDTVIVPLYPEV